MAELDDLDDDLDDVLGGGEPEALEAPASASSGSFTRKRVLVLVGLFVAVLVIAGLLYFVLAGGNEKPRVTGLSKVQAEKLEATRGNKSKKKKKIKYAPLFAQITAEESTKVLRQLSYAGISFNSIQAGKNFAVEVDETELERAKVLLAMKGLPSGGPSGYELLDNGQTLGVTEFDKRIRYVRALAGEIEKAINDYDSIESSKVQIVLPEQRLFAVTQPPVTTSVLIRKNIQAVITDEIVFSIIQFVTNSVENLQQENVTVVDTEGEVLSEGIFERMAAKEAGLLVDDPLSDLLSDGGPSVDKGEPLIPNFTEIEAWFKIRERFETVMSQRLYRQLSGVLPIGSYKVAVSTDLGLLNHGEIADVRRILIGVVVDNNDPDIYLDDSTREMIFNTVGVVSGYVTGRDRIVLTTADFLMFTPLEKEQIMAMFIYPTSYFWLYLSLGLLGLCGAGFYGYRYRKKKLDSLDLDNSGKLDKVETGFSGSKDFRIGGPLTGAMTLEQEEDRIKSLLSVHGGVAVELMEQWLTEEKEEVLV